MTSIHDGPASGLFKAITLAGNASFKSLAKTGVSQQMQDAAEHAPSGNCTGWGIPFEIKKLVFAKAAAVTVEIDKLKAPWLVFMHTTDLEPLEWNDQGLLSPARGIGRLGEHIADYVLVYADGSEARYAIKRRHQIGMFQRIWGENCFEAVAHRKPSPMPPVHEQAWPFPDAMRIEYYGKSQSRVRQPDILPWVNWLWAWEHPNPEKKIVALRIEPHGWGFLLSGMAAGTPRTQPLRWGTRHKAVFTLPKGTAFDRTLDAQGNYKQIQIDLGQIISAQPRTIYPNDRWAESYDNQVPELSSREVLVEYAAHPDARIYLGTKKLALENLLDGKAIASLTPVAPSTRRVRLRVIDAGSGKAVPVKLHVHGEAGEYLAPLDRHRIPNFGWVEDNSVDFVNQGIHFCTYINGETMIDLPLGRVFVEVSKGFEIRPVKQVISVGPETDELTITIEKVLPWRERGWVTADTHVHCISPSTAQFEGAAEGVNIVNLLATQWGDLMTNVGDFDGKTTFGSKEAGGDGEWLVRVGTENRQHVLGHISLLGYAGDIIVPMCVGGPDESAIGDPVSVLMSDWAKQCKSQGGLVIMPHYPNPRCESAANLISGEIDAVEMASWGNLYGGIDPYSLSDWYRYLNCGFFHAAVGGTDKMAASTPVGAVRTYARIEDGQEFTYATWMDTVRAGRTFVTYGPLMEFSVDGKPAGTRIELKASGGTLDVEWELASVTVPMTRVELVVNGEIRQSLAVDARHASDQWAVKIEKSSWLAVLVRGKYPDRPEMIAAHSSPVMAPVEGSVFFAAADAMTILEQIEGALAYLDVIGTRAETENYKRMRMYLTGAHRRLHNEMHRHGHDHTHTHVHDHSDHHD